LGTSRLLLYNSALLICKERGLSSLSENVKARRLLDQVWSDNGVRYCLEQGQWQFAMRTQQVDYDPDIDPQFGYSYAFGKPTDWVLTSAMCSDERFQSPLRNYVDEVDNWYADITPIYIKYVSDDESYGGDLSRWPATFCDYAATYFASKIVTDISGSRELIDLILHQKTGLLDQSLMKAKNRAAMTQAAQRPAAGSWVRARASRGHRGPMGDGGASGSLTG